MAWVACRIFFHQLGLAAQPFGVDAQRADGLFQIVRRARQKAGAELRSGFGRVRLRLQGLYEQLVLIEQIDTFGVPGGIHPDEASKKQ